MVVAITEPISSGIQWEEAVSKVILDVSGQADQCQAYQNADLEEKDLAAGNGGICRVYCINKLVKKAGWDH